MKSFFIVSSKGSALLFRRFTILVLIALSGGMSQLAWANPESYIPSFPRPDVLMTGVKLLAGQSLTSINGNYKLLMQTDGNLVVYNGATPIWASNTNSSPGYLYLQADGNLVLRNSFGNPTWATNTFATDVSNQSINRYLRLTDSGKLVIHGDRGKPGWYAAKRYDAVRFYSRTMKNYSGKPMCMDVKDAQTSNGTNIQLWDCNHYAEGDAQSFIYNESDTTIRMRSNKNKCVDLTGNSEALGTNIQIYDCNGTDAQKFIYDEVGGTIKYKMNSAKCLDISSVRSSTDLNGTNIQLWYCNGGGAQQFDMGVSGGSGIPIWINSTSFAKRTATNKCIDVLSSGTANGTKVQLWDCNGGAAQQFSYNKMDGTIKMANNNNKCLDIASTGKMQLWDCNTAQLPRFDVDFVTGQIRLRTLPESCVDIAGNGTGNGTEIQSFSCNGTNAQQFNLNGQIQRFSVDLRDVDYDVYVYVNGTQRVYSKDKNPGLKNIDASWLTNYGDNEIVFWLGNAGGGASSLGISLYRNMENQPAVMRNVSLPQTNGGGYQAEWKYNVNTITGRIREIK